MDNHKDTPSDKIHEATIVNNEYAREIWNAAIKKATISISNLRDKHDIANAIIEIQKLKV